jgi:hypothetical protein
MSNTESAAQVLDAGVPYDGYGPPPEDGSPHDAGYLIPLPAGPGYEYIDPAEGLGSGIALASDLLNLVPVLGDIKGIVEAVTGKDLLTRDELGYIGRTLNLLPLLGAAGEFAAAKAALRAAARETSDVAETLAREAQAADVVRRAALAAKDGPAASAATLEMLDKLDEAAVALAQAADAASEGARLGSPGTVLKELAEKVDQAVDIAGLVAEDTNTVDVVGTPAEHRVPTDSGPPHPVDESDAPASPDQAGAPSMADVASYDPSTQGDLTSQADDDPSSQGGDAAAGTFNMEQDAAAVKDAGAPAIPAEEQQASFPGDDEEPDPGTEQSTAEQAPAEAVDACFPGDDETSAIPGTSGDAATSGEAGASPQTSTDDGDDGFGE